MKKPKKNPKDRYQARLLQEFGHLKSEEAMLEVLQYTRFVREEEKELEKLNSQQKASPVEK